MSPQQYTEYGLPWFDLYGDSANAVSGSFVLDGLKGIAKVAKRKRHTLDDNASVTGERVIALRRGLAKGQVREGSF